MQNKKAVNTPVSLVNTKGNLSFQWENLPKTGSNGEQLYYSVEEVSVTKNNRGVNESGYKKSVFSDILSICQ